VKSLKALPALLLNRRYTEPVTLRPEISERLDRAADISQETGIDTITDTFGAWARLPRLSVSKGLEL
jgi:hypothetical protein